MASGHPHAALRPPVHPPSFSSSLTCLASFSSCSSSSARHSSRRSAPRSRSPRRSATTAPTHLIPQGWAATVTAVVCARPGAGGVPLAPAGGAWSASARVAVAGGASWPVALVAHPSDKLLDADAPDGRPCADAWTWTLAPEATAALAPGVYALTVELDVAGLVEPLTSQPIAVTVAAPPASPTPDEWAARELRRADHERLHGRTAESRAAVEAVVAAQPGHAGARLRQADALAADGQHVRAALAIEAALAALPDALWAAAEPPVGLLDARAAHVRAAAAQEAFAVTREPKAPGHPAGGTGAAWTFALDGVQGRALALRRGTAYTFRLAGVPADAPFHFATDAAGTSAFTSGVEGAPATGDATVTFTPGADAPDVLYYASPAAPHAGWRIYVEGGATDAPGAPAAADALALSAPAPNPAAREARLTLNGGPGGAVTVELFDALGRRVATVFEGATAPGAGVALTVDTSRLPAGVYAVRATGGCATAARRLTVAR